MHIHKDIVDTFRYAVTPACPRNFLGFLRGESRTVQRPERQSLFEKKKKKKKKRLKLFQAAALCDLYVVVEVQDHQVVLLLVDILLVMHLQVKPEKQDEGE